MVQQSNAAGSRSAAARLTAPPTEAHEPSELASNLDEPTRHALVDRYRGCVRARLEERELVVDRGTTPTLQVLAQEIGDHAGTPRDVVDLHLLAVREWAESSSHQRSRAIVSAAETVLIETLGHLATHYRALALAQPGSWRSESTA